MINQINFLFGHSICLMMSVKLTAATPGCPTKMTIYPSMDVSTSDTTQYLGATTLVTSKVNGTHNLVPLQESKKSL